MNRYRFSLPPYTNYKSEEFPTDYDAFLYTHDLYPPAPHQVKVWKVIDNQWHEWTIHNRWEPRNSC